MYEEMVGDYDETGYHEKTGYHHEEKLQRIFEDQHCWRFAAVQVDSELENEICLLLLWG